MSMRLWNFSKSKVSKSKVSKSFINVSMYLVFTTNWGHKSKICPKNTVCKIIRNFSSLIMNKVIIKNLMVKQCSPELKLLSRFRASLNESETWKHISECVREIIQ